MKLAYVFAPLFLRPFEVCTRPPARLAPPSSAFMDDAAMRWVAVSCCTGDMCMSLTFHHHKVLYYMKDDGSHIVELVKLLIEEYPAISEVTLPQ